MFHEELLEVGEVGEGGVEVVGFVDVGVEGVVDDGEVSGSDSFELFLHFTNKLYQRSS